MGNPPSPLTGTYRNDLLTANGLIWAALLIAVSIVLWETTYLVQAVPVVAIAAVASHLVLLWGSRRIGAETRE